MPEREVGVEDNSVDAIIGSSKQRTIIGTQIVWHSWVPPSSVSIKESTRTTPFHSTAPTGATFAERSLGKGVDFLNPKTCTTCVKFHPEKSESDCDGET